MAHDYVSSTNELSLEPMEIEIHEDRVFGDFSSRDRKPKGRAARAQKVSQAEATESQKSESNGKGKKMPAGKANFFMDDRSKPDRRKADRRSWVRLTGDRRAGFSRRGRTDPWDKAFRS